ncbi:MAG: hyfB 2 [Firmicutes bacterium]|nr:hyfB 2 [Bacillota bacterium]
MNFTTIYLLMLLIFAVGLIITPVLCKKLKVANLFAHGIALLGSLAAVLCASFVFVTGPQAFSLPLYLPFMAFSVRVDYLAAYFLAIIGLVGAAASIYAVAYGREYFKRRFIVMAELYLAFLLSMLLVVSVSHVFAFLVVWEVMSVASFMLVGQEYDNPVSTKAAYLYLVMTHIGTAFIMTAFLLLAKTSGSMEFAELSALGADTWTKNAIFLCALIGFGTKAGLIPLHIWLPKAHPAAPTHVSALMSGVMLKTAIYGMTRFYLEFLGVGPAWWGGIILLFAIVSAVLGVLYAMMEHDIKSLLAYSSVENIGLIMLGMGAGMVLMSNGLTTLAGLAWAAALFHVLNHAVFKALLFFGAGAVISVTHTRDIEQHGGLIKVMPYTAVVFLIGAAAISALPPFNGFVSEWLIFQVLFNLPAAIGGVLGKMVAAVLISLLGLTGALAAACFVKAYGMIFLAKPRGNKAEQASEVSGFMLVPMFLMAILCLVLGIIAPKIMVLLRDILAPFFSEGVLDSLVNSAWYVLGFQQGQVSAGLSLPALGVVFGAGIVLAAIFYLLNGLGKSETGETWTCGIVPNARMEYTATGFSGPIRRAFGKVLLPQTEKVINTNTSPYSGWRVIYEVHITHVVDELVYQPLNRRIVIASRFMKEIQTGSVQLYIGYIMAVTIGMLIWSTRW